MASLLTLPIYCKNSQILHYLIGCYTAEIELLGPCCSRSLTAVAHVIEAGGLEYSIVHKHTSVCDCVHSVSCVCSGMHACAIVQWNLSKMVSVK